MSNTHPRIKLSESDKKKFLKKWIREHQNNELIVTYLNEVCEFLSMNNIERDQMSMSMFEVEHLVDHVFNYGITYFNGSGWLVRYDYDFECYINIFQKLDAFDISGVWATDVVQDEMVLTNIRIEPND